MNKVKLIIWDLDQVLWDGILAENTNISNNKRYNLSKKVIPFLNNRGIINSICSKNDFNKAKNELEIMGIFKYFIFPKIEFSNKGLLVKQIIEECNFRPINVIFVDDNIINRNEVLYYTKDITIKDENFLFDIITDDFFTNLKKKNRLNDYKLLEKKKKDKKNKFNNDNEKFLKSLKLQCYLYSVTNANFKKHKSRIFELLNRTNQLNYTKIRVKVENDILYYVMKYDFYIVNVKDIYAEYNTIGIICFDSKNKILLHFCFSCRLLGLMIENKLYEYFNYPNIKIIDGVAIPLEKKKINWIKIYNKGKSELYKVKNISYPYTDTLCIRGSCEISYLFNSINRLNNLIIKKQKHDNVSENHTSLIYLSQNPAKKGLKLLLKDSNYYNSNYFRKDKDSDIYLFSIADTLSSTILLHKPTNLYVSLTTYEIEKNFDFINDNNFEIQGAAHKKFSLSEFENIIKKVIYEYKDKIIIFQNGYSKSEYYTNYIDIIKKYINFRNIFLLDVNKFATDNSKLVGGHRNHFIQEVNINLWIELVSIIRNIYNTNSKLYPIFFSNFFENCYITKHGRNFIKINQIYEDIFEKRLLSINLTFNNYKNIEDCNNSGIYFSFPSYFIKKYNKYFPVRKYKFSFYSKINSHTKNNITHKIRIFTGIKWIESCKILTNKYMEYKFEEVFDFNNTSTYRIIYTNIYEDLCINIYNPMLIELN